MGRSDYIGYSSYMQFELIPIPEDTAELRLKFTSEHCRNLFDMWDTYYKAIGYHAPWVGYLALKDGVPVGSGAFTGRPVDGEVEVSYWAFQEFEGQGLGTDICKELVRLALMHDPKLKVFAKTMPQENASTNILRKNGFEYAGDVEDHEIGKAWKWVYRP